MGKEHNQREGPENQTNSDTDKKKFNAGAIARITMAASHRTVLLAVKAESVKNRQARQSNHKSKSSTRAETIPTTTVDIRKIRGKIVKDV